MPLAKDLLYPLRKRRTHKQRLVQSPSSCFTDVSRHLEKLGDLRPEPDRKRDGPCSRAAVQMAGCSLSPFKGTAGLHNLGARLLSRHRETENSREGLGTGRSFGDDVRNRTSSHYRYCVRRTALWLSGEEAASQCRAVGSTPRLRRGHMPRGRQAREPQRPKPQPASPRSQEEPPQ
uniref:Uncharacterized protein n=1 Tax=Rangifer tarandus platyrhynchus TaxID=3082113 RepID=A0ACB0F5X9_RANTA|nr:unnamed protein product [Rangifer tarandus platyrhynchus]